MSGPYSRYNSRAKGSRRVDTRQRSACFYSTTFNSRACRMYYLVPSIGVATIWHMKIASPTTKGANVTRTLFSMMMNRMVKQRQHVRSASANTAWASLKPGLTLLTPSSMFAVVQFAKYAPRMAPTISAMNNNTARNHGMFPVRNKASITPGFKAPPLMGAQMKRATVIEAPKLKATL